MDYFKAVNQKFGGLAKSARFVARIMPVGALLKNMHQSNPSAEDLLYLCEAAEYPGRGFMNVDLRYYGPSFKLPYQSSYEDINMTFLCRNEGYEREFFDNWMELINPVQTFNFNYRKEYECMIEIFQIADYADSSYGGFNRNQNVDINPPAAKYSHTLLHAYPVLINPQQITWADDQFLRLGVTFTYHWWTRVSLDEYGASRTQQPFSLSYIIP